jgi:hypothetical protein
VRSDREPIALEVDERDRRRPESARPSARNREEMGPWPHEPEPGERSDDQVDRAAPRAESIRASHGTIARRDPDAGGREARTLLGVGSTEPGKERRQWLCHRWSGK